MKVLEPTGMRDATAEEIVEWEKAAAQQPTPELTPEERIAALEKELRETRLLLGLEDAV